MKELLNIYWDETAANEKAAADAAELEKVVASRKPGTHRSRTQKHKDSIRIGKRRHEEALHRYEEVPVPGKLRFHQMPRDKGSDNIHNVRAEQAAKVAMQEFGYEVDIAEEAVPA